LPTFRKAGLIFVTYSNTGGLHHVEVHRRDWWRSKLEFYGFRYLEDVTTEIRTMAWKEANNIKTDINPKEKQFKAAYIYANMMVFLNPLVAALPEHAHLLYEPGCFHSNKNGILIQRECGDGTKEDFETPLPNEFKPLTLTKVQDEQWIKRVKLMK
jgi:hypothetical protein